jgi:hypothetical protein
MRQVTPVVELKGKDGVARIDEGVISREIGLRPAMWLNVREFGVEKGLKTLDAQILASIDELATPIVTMAREAFRVFGDHDAGHRQPRFLRRIILAANQLDPLVLPFRLQSEDVFDFPIHRRPSSLYMEKCLLFVRLVQEINERKSLAVKLGLRRQALNVC